MSEKGFNFYVITRFQMYQAHKRNRSNLWRSSLKKVFLKFSQSSKENTGARASGPEIY